MVQALLIIVLGLTAGVALGRLLASKGWTTFTHRLQRTLQVTALTVFNPIAFVGALWALPDLDPRLLLLPLVGLATLVIAFALGALVARTLRLDPQRAVLFRTGVSYTNLGNLGGLSVFQILGEAGYALVPLYKLLEELWIYGFLFPHTNPQKSPRSLSGALAKVLKDPFVLIVVAALTLGFVLRLSGIPRPALYGTLLPFIVPASTLFLLVAVGLTLRFSFSPQDVRPALALTGLKILVLPLVSLAFTALAGFGPLPLVWKAALILSCMPMAFLSMIPPTLYRLDGRFTATAWGLSMLSLGITLPILSLLLA